MTAETREKLRSTLVAVVEDTDDAEQKGETLSRDAIATLVTRLTEALNANGVTRTPH
jgi:hypothetical protein